MIARFIAKVELIYSTTTDDILPESCPVTIWPEYDYYGYDEGDPVYVGIARNLAWVGGSSDYSVPAYVYAEITVPKEYQKSEFCLNLCDPPGVTEIWAYPKKKGKK